MFTQASGRQILIFPQKGAKTMFDDSDMKIVGAAGKKAEELNTAATLAEIGEQHFNGNFARAKSLGANIVSAFSYKAAPEELKETVVAGGVTPDETVMREVRFLSVFSAQYCLQRYISSPMLSSVAMGEMYDVLQEVSPALYEELSQTTAFSFYYMSLKNGGGVGEAFAAQCGKKGDGAFIALGETLHRLNCDVFKRAIRSYAFV